MKMEEITNKWENPILLKIDDWKDNFNFLRVMDEYAYEIHSRMLYTIDYASNTNNNEEIVIAYINDEETVLGVNKNDWLKNLEKSLNYFEEIEDYEKCQEVQQLINKINV